MTTQEKLEKQEKNTISVCDTINENKECDRCLRCGRKLKTQETRKLGFGKVCYEKYLVRSETKRLFTI